MSKKSLQIGTFLADAWLKTISLIPNCIGEIARLTGVKKSLNLDRKIEKKKSCHYTAKAACDIVRVQRKL